MAFGIDNTAANGKKMQSVSEANAVNTAMINGPDGEPVEQRTFHQVATVTNEFYLGDADVYVNGATAGQSGGDVITASTLNSTNSDFQRVTETHQKFIPPSSSTQST